MSNSVRLGLVGAGRRGRYVAQLFAQHPHCEVTAVMDKYPRITEVAADKLGLSHEQSHESVEAMWPHVDALFFACDPYDQVKLACASMQAGKHVCTEVPAALSIDDCWQLVRTVEETGCCYQLMEQTRHWGFIEHWQSMHQRGELGHVCYAQGEYIHYERGWQLWTNDATGETSIDFAQRVGEISHWRNKVLGNPIYYLPHTLSPLLKILDDRVERVSCMGTRKQSYTYEEAEVPWRDIEYALMHTRKDTVLSVGAGFSLPYVNRGATSSHWYELRGTKGSVESPRCRDDGFRVWHPGQASYETQDLSTVPSKVAEHGVEAGHGGADFEPVSNFIDAILSGQQPEMNVYRAVETAAPAILAAQSADEGGTLLEVPDFRAA